MDKFVDKLATHIFENYNDLSELTIILPSQRAKKYLQRALFKTYKKPIFSPKIITVNKWITDLSPFPIIEPTRALFKLYEIHKKIDSSKDKGLEEFLKWGKTLLSDFDEIDRYLVDPKQLFKNLTEIKEIENWSFNEEELTDAQKRFMEFWDLLPRYYEELNKNLEKEGEGYIGNAYKYVANNIEVCFKSKKSEKFIFAGFNALSSAEISIIKQLHKMGRAEVFIDADAFYLENNMHEAGTFLRKLMSELNVKKLPFTENQLASDSKNINIYNCITSSGQAKVSASILKSQIPHEEYDETLLLLADEGLIVPIIKNIPANIEKANITLGLPLKNTALKAWVELLFSAQNSSQKFKTDAIFHRDFIRFVKHPFIHRIINEKDREVLQKLEHRIISKNILFISPKKLELTQQFKEIIELTFKGWENNYIKGLANIRSLNQLIFNAFSEEGEELEKAVIVNFDKSIGQFENIVSEFHQRVKLNNVSLDSFRQLFQQHWANSSVAYYGNPLDGVQIMGLLETRLLDFKNIIVVGLNDKKMPPGNPIQTLIPMDLRSFNNLPMPRDKHGLFAHHFYRLLHHAENIWITYSSAQSSSGVEEPSPYVHQLELELARQNKNITLKKFDYTIKDNFTERGAVSVSKSEALLKRLDEYFANGTSASAINTFLNCPLDFYYKYILGFGEEDDVEESLEAGALGSIIHETLEKLYKPYAKNEYPDAKPISTAIIDNMLANFHTTLEQVFNEYYGGEKNEYVRLGKNYLSLEMAKELVSSFLKDERKKIEEHKGHFFVKSVEEKLIATNTYSVHGEDKEIKFTGYVDRIDDWNNDIRIIDYKTGNCNQDKVTIKQGRGNSDPKEKLKTILSKERFILQLLIYQKLYKEKYGVYAKNAGIIALPKLKDGPYFLTNELTDSFSSLMELFDEVLIEIFEDMYDTSLSIEHNTKSDYCEYC